MRSPPLWSQDSVRASHAEGLGSIKYCTIILNSCSLQINAIFDFEKYIPLNYHDVSYYLYGITIIPVLAVVDITDMTVRFIWLLLNN